MTIVYRGTKGAPLSWDEVDGNFSDLQTNKIGPSDLTAHTSLSSGVHGAIGTVVGTTNTQTLTNKTLTSPAINSPTGIVKGDVGLGNVDNTSDANKPVSSAQSTAISGAVSTHAGLTATHGVSGAIVGTTNTQTLTNKTLTAPVISGGTIDNTSIGGSTSAAGSFTTITASQPVIMNGNVTTLPVPPTSSGQDYLQIGAADGKTANIVLDTWTVAPSIIGRQAGGTCASPSSVQTSKSLLNISGYGYGATGYSSATRVAINMQTSEAWTDTAQGTQMTFKTTALGTTTTSSRIQINTDSSVSIGAPVGSESLKAIPVTSAVNRVEVSGAITGSPPQLAAAGTDTDIDLKFIPQGAGLVRFGTYAAKAAEAFAGYITIKDAGGASRKVMVCA